MSIPDKTVRDLGDGTPVGNLDGLEPLDDKSFLVTDWVAGALYRIDTSGKADNCCSTSIRAAPTSARCRPSTCCSSR